MRATEIPEALAGVVSLLRDAGLAAVTDPRDLNPPGAVVALGPVQFNLLCGDCTAEATVYLVAPDVGMDQNVATLAQLLDTAAAVAPPSDLARPDSFIVPGAGQSPLPAIRYTTQIGH